MRPLRETDLWNPLQGVLTDSRGTASRSRKTCIKWLDILGPEVGGLQSLRAGLKDSRFKAEGVSGQGHGLRALYLMTTISKKQQDSTYCCFA